MKLFFQVESILKDEQGVSATVVALLIFVLLGFAALAIDIGHLFAVRNELQNGADAGALAGARFLYNDDGTVVNTGANQIAYDAATANRSETGSGSEVAVEVNWTGGNGGDVQRGHWSFATSTFTPNDSTAPVDLWDVSAEELDANLNFINAVRVVTRRAGTPVVSFFARIFGRQDFQLSTDAVAYIGFEGSMEPGGVDQPIAICRESITINGEYSCNIGRMLNSGSDAATNNTAGWTNFSQDPCDTASASEMGQLVCSGGNPDFIEFGQGMGATGGVQQVTFDALRDCWGNGANDLNDDGFRETPIDTDGDGIPDQPWNLTLPVVECPGNNVSNCPTVTGTVNLNVVWITEAGTAQWEDAPTKMGSWSYPADPDNTNGQERWADFVTYFNLRNADDSPAPFAKKSVYFLPDCTVHEPAGTTGGDNYGILARIPVLVE